MRLIILLFTLPWWLYFPLAGGIFYAGNLLFDQQTQIEAIHAEALTQGIPDPVDLGAYDETLNRNAANEVNVEGWINTEYNYSLVKRRNGIKTSERYMYLLFGLEDGPDTRAVKAAIVLSPAEKETFLNALDSFITGELHGDYTFQFNGFARDYDNMSGMVGDAIAEQGLTKDGDFFYLEPFLDGREAALTPVLNGPENTRSSVRLAALLAALYGIARRFLRSGPKPATATEPDPMEATRSYSPKAPGGANKAYDYDYAFAAKQRDVGLSQNVSPDSPLGRIAMRNAQAQAQAEPTSPERFEADTSSQFLSMRGEHVESRKRGGPPIRLLVLGVIACGLFLPAVKFLDLELGLNTTPSGGTTQTPIVTEVVNDPAPDGVPIVENVTNDPARAAAPEAATPVESTPAENPVAETSGAGAESIVDKVTGFFSPFLIFVIIAALFIVKARRDATAAQRKPAARAPLTFAPDPAEAEAERKARAAAQPSRLHPHDAAARRLVDESWTRFTRTAKRSAIAYGVIGGGGFGVSVLLAWTGDEVFAGIVNMFSTVGLFLATPVVGIVLLVKYLKYRAAAKSIGTDVIEPSVGPARIPDAIPSIAASPEAHVDPQTPLDDDAPSTQVGFGTRVARMLVLLAFFAITGLLVAHRFQFAEHPLVADRPFAFLFDGEALAAHFGITPLALYGGAIAAVVLLGLIFARLANAKTSPRKSEPARTSPIAALAIIAALGVFGFLGWEIMTANEIVPYPSVGGIAGALIGGAWGARRFNARKAAKAAVEHPGPTAIPTTAKPATKVSDTLQGSRAWVSQTARTAPATARHVTVNPRKKMRLDPFEKLAMEARGQL